jgi:hypothetical protein
MVEAISLSISPFLVIDANTNQSKYKVYKCNLFAFCQMCISYFEMKAVLIKYDWFDIVNILDHICTT